MKPILVREQASLNSSILFDVDEYDYFYNPWHYHPELELTLVLKSYGQRQVGDSIENFQAGDLVLVGSNLPHVWKNDEIYFQNNPEIKAQAIVVKFQSDFAGQDFFKLPEMKQIGHLINEVSQFGLELTGELRSKVNGMMRELIHQDESERLLHFLKILDLISKSREYKLLSSLSYRNENIKNSHRINTVLDYIMEHYYEEIRLESVAKLINMNKNAFCRFFKKGTQKTLFSVIQEVRIRKACQFLVETDMNILQVCYACGFGNVSGFNKTFKKITGTTPLAYRKNIKSRMQETFELLQSPV